MVIGLLVLLVLFANTVHAEGLEVQIADNNEQIVYGKSFDIKLIAYRINAPIQTIRIKPLLRNFAVEYLDKDPGTIERQILWLRLHPRRAGKLAIPSIKFYDYYNEPVVVDVKAPEFNGQPIKVTAKMDRMQLWQRQQGILSITIDSPQRFYSVDFDRFELRGFELIAIEPNKSVEKKNGETHHLTRFGWILIPLTVDDYQISIPGIRYLESGVSQYEFYTPQLNLSVKRLPSYIGPNIVVGKLKYRLRHKPEFVHNNDKIKHIEYELFGEGIIEDWLPRIDDQFSESDALQFFPTINKTTLSKTFDGLNSTQVTTVPYLANAIGWNTIPTVETQYFDPDLGKLQTARVAGFTIIAYSPQINYVVGGILLLTVVVWIVSKRERLYGIANKHLRRRRALVMLKHASKIRELMSALRAYSDAFDLHPNPNLTQLLAAWETRHVSNPLLRSLFDELNQLYYAKPLAKTDNNDEKDPSPANVTRLARQFYRRLLGKRDVVYRIATFLPLNAVTHQPSRY